MTYNCRHVLFKDSSLNGWEYGMLRSFENAIISQNDAECIEIPVYKNNKLVDRHFGHGMKRGVYRHLFPKQRWMPPQGDVVWHILMGPENYRLDLFEGWQNLYKYKVLYLYDTLPSQYPQIKRLFSNSHWDLLITSFDDAKEDLENITGREWYTIAQAADSSLFKFLPLEERKIHFSSYGRRVERLHSILIKFCKERGLYYDFTCHDGKHPTADPSLLYSQYAWHLSNSVFTFSWPVEKTNPVRSGHLSPITCRWFEAAASGTIVLGDTPTNQTFKHYFGDSFVTGIDTSVSDEIIFSQLNLVWENRSSLFKTARTIHSKLAGTITWESRVNEINQIISQKRV